MSDLHLEFFDSFDQALTEVKDITYIIENPPHDPEAVLVLAGDIGWPVRSRKDKNHNDVYTQFLKTMRQIFKYVVVVAGNHEYYPRIGILETDEVLHVIARDADVIFLQRETWTHPSSGVVFAGCTLWTKITGNAVSEMNDRKYVYSSQQYALALHKRDRKWIKDTLQNSAGPIIMVTHHPPSFQCLADQYVGQVGVDFTGYATNLEKHLVPPVLKWICGHTHCTKSVAVNKSFIIMNGTGYDGDNSETNPGPYQL